MTHHIQVNLLLTHRHTDTQRHIRRHAGTQTNRHADTQSDKFIDIERNILIRYNSLRLNFQVLELDKLNMK